MVHLSKYDFAIKDCLTLKSEVLCNLCSAGVDLLTCCVKFTVSKSPGRCGQIDDNKLL